MPKRYPDAKIDEALLAYYTLGTYEKASAATGMSASAIHRLVTETHTDRYDELAAKHGPKLEQRLVAKLGQIQDQAAGVLKDSVTATSDALTAGNSKDASAYSGAAKNLALIVGITTDKKLTLEGRPTLISEHRDTDDLLRSLKTLGVVVEGTAIEVPNHAAQLEAAPTTLGAIGTQAKDKRVNVPQSA